MTEATRGDLSGARKGGPTTAGRGGFESGLLVFGPLSLFGELLLSRTHHRPLAAVTFSLVALAFWGMSEMSLRAYFPPTRDGRWSPKKRNLLLCVAFLDAVLVARAFL